MQSGARRAAVAPFLLWCVPGVVALLLVTPLRGHHDALNAISATALIFGLWAFWQHGGRQVTAAGVYSLSSAAFVGYAGLWWAQNASDVVEATIFQATMVLYYTHIVAYYVFWRRTSSAERYPGVTVGSDRTSIWAVTTGAGVLAASIALSRVAPGLATGYTASAAAGVMLLAIGLATRPKGASLGLWRTLLAGAALAAYTQTIFTGFGRLTVATLAIAIAIAVASRMKGRRVKLAVVAGVPVGAFLLTQIRQSAVESVGNGPDSMQAPLETFGRLLRTDFEHGDGSTLWATLTLFVPRAWWEGKPIGFGAELTEMLEPGLVGVGHSMASTIGGEWYYNFGWIGLLSLPVVVGLLVAWLDRGLANALGGTFTIRRDVVVLTAWIAGAAGLSNLVWASTFTYVNRTGFILIVLALIRLVASKESQEDRPSGRLRKRPRYVAGVRRVGRADRKQGAGHPI